MNASSKNTSYLLIPQTQNRVRLIIYKWRAKTTCWKKILTNIVRLHLSIWHIEEFLLLSMTIIALF